VKPADGDAVTFTTRLPPGRYAAGAGGFPLEGYGVTNNPKPRFRKATFDESTFTLSLEGAEKTISIQYF
jgi:uncharacterized protein (DUF2141 family)